MIKLAWKNVWRNKLRSLVMLGAIMLGMVGGSFLVGFMNGWVDERINDVISNEMTHLQINTSEFIDQPDIENNFNYTDIEPQIRKVNHVIGVSPRVILNGMVATAHKSMGIQVFGIDPEKEKSVSNIYQYITDSLGNYFDNDVLYPTVVGADLAKELKLKKGSKVVISTVSVDGEQTSAAFRVCGIFNIKNPTFEKSRLFVKSQDLRTITGLSDSVIHELAIRLSDQNNSTVVQAKQEIAPYLKPHEINRSWKEISTMMAVYTEFLKYELMILVGLILFALGFGIVNTSLMSVMERRRELSMLMAIGMNKRKVRTLIMLETVILTSTGGFLGMAVGYLLIVITGHTGIDISASMSSVGELGFPTIIHPYISVGLFIGIAVLVMITGIVSAIYPAKYATALKPAEGIRE